MKRIELVVGVGIRVMSLLCIILGWLLGNGCAFWMMNPVVLKSVSVSPHRRAFSSRVFHSSSFYSSSGIMKRGVSVGRNGYNMTFLEKVCEFNVTRYHELYTDYRWNHLFGILQEYETEFGHVHVPYRAVYQNESLGRWITNIRSWKRQGSLPSFWIHKFTNDLQTEFYWDNPPTRIPPPTTTTTSTNQQDNNNNNDDDDDDWNKEKLLLPNEPMIYSTTLNQKNEQQHQDYNDKCLQLFRYHRQQQQNNTTITTTSYSFESLCQTFSKSTSAQLTLWRKYTLPDIRNSPEFDFLREQQNTSTDYYIQELKDFHDAYGHSYVPLAYPNSSLGSFIYNLRNNKIGDKQLKTKLQTKYNVDFDIDEISFQQKAYPVLAQLRSSSSTVSTPSNDHHDHDDDDDDDDGYYSKLFQEETQFLQQQSSIDTSK